MLHKRISVCVYVTTYFNLQIFFASGRKVSNKPSQTNVSVDLFLITMPPAPECSEPRVLCALEMRRYCQKKKFSFLPLLPLAPSAPSQLLIPLPSIPHVLAAALVQLCDRVWKCCEVGKFCFLKLFHLDQLQLHFQRKESLGTFVATLFSLQRTWV